MIARISDFSTIICAHELEALVLESTLIKKHMPPYNILLRDDRDYPYIRVTMNEMYPRVLKAFRIGPDRSEGAVISDRTWPVMSPRRWMRFAPSFRLKHAAGCCRGISARNGPV
jgi:hypothetical protein